MEVKGFGFKRGIDFNQSEVKNFKIENNTIYFPFTAITGIGDKVAEKIMDCRQKQGKITADWKKELAEGEGFGDFWPRNEKGETQVSFTHEHYANNARAGEKEKVSRQVALKRAEEVGLDLLCVSTTPPVCKLVNYYKLKKGEKKSKKGITQEVKISYNTDENDLRIKLNKIQKLIEKGSTVKVNLVRRGREKSEEKVEIDEKYPIDGVCKRDKDPENKGKKRDQITKLDLSRGNLGKHFYSSSDGEKILAGSLKLEGFTNLRVLIISSHQLTSLDVNDCSNLEELDCQNNQIDNLKFAGCSKLKKLIVCNNKLEEVDVNHCPILDIETAKSDLDYDDKRKKFVRNLGRKEYKSLKIQEKNLEGELDLTDFVNLEELYCYHNKLTKIKFADGSVDKLKGLFVGNNNFPKQDLSFFGKLNSLRVLNLGNNNFFGSLKPLKNLLNLESLDISDTDIDDGLENLRESKLEGIYCQVKERENAKCQKIQEELKKYCTGNNWYDFKKEPKRKPEIPVKNVLLIGKTGSGKSNLANVLTKSEEFKSSASSTSVTKNVGVKKISHNGINYRIIDTVGLGDTELTSEELLDNVLTDYRFLSSFLFDKKVFRYTTIVRTNFPEFKNKQECENDRERIKNSIEILGSSKGQMNIVYVDSPPPSYGEEAKKRREESRKVLLKHLEDISDINYEPMNGENVYEASENENYPEFIEFKNEVVLKQKKLSEQKAKKLLKRLKETIEEEKKDLEELIKDCKESLSEGKKKNKDLLERKVDELLEQSNYQDYQDKLKKAKKELKKHLDSKEVENLARQKEKVIKLEMLAKTLKKTKRYQIQERILEYLQKE
ncbi:18048_t:CDS:10 [Funneliformis geosporum]|nr:18048_t:CDS:10 [Funneliformis geosporum]